MWNIDEYMGFALWVLGGIAFLIVLALVLQAGD